MNQFTNSDPPTSEFNSGEPVTHSEAIVSKILKINRSDRWCVYRRLKELNVSCSCPEDGTLWVEINGWVEAILLRSTIQHFTGSRNELTTWLERCWETKILSTSHS